jgi:hypothetical protein
MTPVHLFFACAGMIALFRLVALRIAPQWHPWAAVGLGALYVLAALRLMPAPRSDPRYRELREAARFAASPASPSPVLYGYYWETLVFAGFQPELAPVVMPDDLQRMPWNVARLRASPAVLLSDFGQGSGPRPEPWVIALGTPLQRRSEEPVYRSGTITFHAYDNRSGAALPVELPPCPRGPVELRFAPARRGWLVAQSDLRGAKVHLDLGQAAAVTQAQETPEARTAAVRFEAREPVTSARLVVEPPEKPEPGAERECGARAWLVADAPAPESRDEPVPGP